MKVLMYFFLLVAAVFFMNASSAQSGGCNRDFELIDGKCEVRCPVGWSRDGKLCVFSREDAKKGGCNDNTVKFVDQCYPTSTISESKNQECRYADGKMLVNHGEKCIYICHPSVEDKNINIGRFSIDSAGSSVIARCMPK